MVHVCLYSKAIPQCMFYCQEFITHVSWLILLTITRVAQKHCVLLIKKTNEHYVTSRWIRTAIEEETYSFLKNSVFWDVAPCRSCMNATFRRNVSPPFSGQKHPRVRNKREQVAADWATSRKHPAGFTHDLHGATSQKTVFFIVTFVKTANFSFILISNELKWSL
jgi:hypothetical protein